MTTETPSISAITNAILSSTFSEQATDVPIGSTKYFSLFEDSSTVSSTTTTTATSTTTTTTAAPTTISTTSSVTTQISTLAPDKTTSSYITTDEIEPATSFHQHGPKFPYPVVAIIVIWVILLAAYFVARWRQKPKSNYVIPRVFVLCSPRTVQFHYELILRIGLPSWDFNPDKHDIDLSILGQQKNEVVPVTRLNTRTLLDEPLITSLSLVVYRLVEMPPLGGLVLKHSGPFRAWVYAYDFTVIDLSTNKEQYYTLNTYIGSLLRVIPLDEKPSGDQNQPSVKYPVDDVPLPQWSLEDMFLMFFTVVNSIVLSVTIMPANCGYLDDIISILLTAVGGGCLVFFLDWLLYYQLRWNQDRKEYFNELGVCGGWCPSERLIRTIIFILGTLIGLACIYYAMSINDWRESLVWFLVVVNSCTLVIGLWNVARQLEVGETIVGCGLRLRGTEMLSVGMRYSELVSDMRTKSGSASDDGGSHLGGRNSGLLDPGTGRLTYNSGGPGLTIGTRSSVKSFGFGYDPALGHKAILSKFHSSRLSATGATPNNQPSSGLLKAVGVPGALSINGHHNHKHHSNKHKSHHHNKGHHHSSGGGSHSKSHNHHHSPTPAASLTPAANSKRQPKMASPTAVQSSMGPSVHSPTGNQSTTNTKSKSESAKKSAGKSGGEQDNSSSVSRQASGSAKQQPGKS